MVWPSRSPSTSTSATSRAMSSRTPARFEQRAGETRQRGRPDRAVPGAWAVVRHDSRWIVIDGRLTQASDCPRILASAPNACRAPHVLPSSLQISIVTLPPRREAARAHAAQARAGDRRGARSRRHAHGAPRADRQQRGPRHRRWRDQAGQDALLRFRACTSPTCMATRTSATAPRTTWCCTAPAPTITSCSIPTSSSRRMRSPTACAGSTQHPDVGALAPLACRRRDGTREYLCKRYPAVLRPAPARLRARRFVRRLFRRRLARYEMRDVMDVDPPRDVIGIPGAVRRVHAGASATRSTAPAASTRASSSTSRISTGACA